MAAAAQRQVVRPGHGRDDVRATNPGLWRDLQHRRRVRRDAPDAAVGRDAAAVPLPAARGHVADERHVLERAVGGLGGVEADAQHARRARRDAVDRAGRVQAAVELPAPGQHRSDELDGRLPRPPVVVDGVRRRDAQHPLRGLRDRVDAPARGVLDGAVPLPEARQLRPDERHLRVLARGERRRDAQHALRVAGDRVDAAVAGRDAAEPLVLALEGRADEAHVVADDLQHALRVARDGVDGARRAAHAAQVLVGAGEALADELAAAEAVAVHGRRRRFVAADLAAARRLGRAEQKVRRRHLAGHWSDEPSAPPGSAPRLSRIEVAEIVDVEAKFAPYLLRRPWQVSAQTTTARSRLRIDPQLPGAGRTNARRAAAKPRSGPKKQQTREAPPIIIEG